MKNKIATAFVLFGLVALSSGISGCASTSPAARRESNYPADKVDARKLFVENCATCHGNDGRAHTFHGWLLGAQNLTKVQWQEETTDSEIIHAIKTGPGAMPAFQKKLSPTEIQALATYVRSLARGV